MTTQEKIQEVITTKISPALQSHGGDVAFVSYDEAAGALIVELTGACGTCPYAQETLRMTVESAIRSEVPEVKSVVRA
ncbi:NifU family protein [Synergistaceae bacterium OttesenSCG-928-D05]|nr:NifU family protein [Synergistaceae bacterium OttesenSCG-928-D05]